MQIEDLNTRMGDTMIETVVGLLLMFVNGEIKEARIQVNNGRMFIVPREAERRFM